MTSSLSQYPLLAALFRYPDAAYPGRAQAAQAALERTHPEAAEALRPFTRFVADAAPVTLEELYTRSFDVQAVTTLDLGYVLFGDDYKRGAMLVHLNREHAAAGNPCHGELADHLPNVLRLLPLMTDEALRAELVARIVLPALHKMIDDFDPEKMARKKKVYLKHHRTWIEQPEGYGTLYRLPLLAVRAALEADFGAREAAPPPATSDFLKNIGTEIVLEADSKA